MVIRSLLTIQGTLHSLDEIRLWIENRNRSIHVSISPVPFSSLDHWSQDEDGTLRHSSGRFFSIEGIRVETANGGGH